MMKMEKDILHFTSGLQRRVLIIVLSSIVLLSSGTGIVQKVEGNYGQESIEKLITLHTKSEKLVDVLTKVSAVFGPKITIDKEWEDIPITASFEQQPLQQALERILRNINHLIIYESNNEIKILLSNQKTFISKIVIDANNQGALFENGELPINLADESIQLEELEAITQQVEVEGNNQEFPEPHYFLEPSLSEIEGSQQHIEEPIHQVEGEVQYFPETVPQ